jgi:hypothetical protein
MIDLEANTENKLKCRSLLLKYNYSKMKDAFNKAADLGTHSCNLVKVENLLKEMCVFTPKI